MEPQIIIRQVDDFVISRYEGDELNLDHNNYVTKMATMLAETLSADQFIAHIAARFHDIDYSRGHKYHPMDSADFAAKYLKSKNLTPQQIQEIRLAILCHSTDQLALIKNPSTEGKILHDADKMWLMTPNGFFRTICHSIAENKSHEFIRQKLHKSIEKYDLLFFSESRELVKDDKNICMNFLRGLGDEKNNRNQARKDRQ